MNGTPIAYPGARIFVVDDEVANVRLISAALTRAGYRHVTEFTAGAVALTAIVEDPPDLILLDLNMPVCSGYDILAALQPLFERSVLPVIVLTADSTTEARERALAAGATDFLTKPLLLADLLLRCANHVRMRMLHLELERVRRTTERQLEDRIRFLAFHDPLTALSNRQRFMEHLQTALAGQRAPVGVMLIDVDDFKALNDSLGHAAGDMALIHMANIVAERAGTFSLPARLGGDEFAVMVEGDDAVLSLQRMARDILKMLSRPVVIEGHEIVLRCSFGISVSTVDDVASEQILRRADVALYTVKRTSKARWAVHTPDMDRDLLGRLALISDVERAVDAGELFLEYQPIIDLRTDAVRSFEALIRWRHPTLGTLSPSQFIPLAEETGFITRIGQWAFQSSIRELSRWHDLNPTVGMSVNVSPRELRDPEFSSSIVEMVQRAGIDPGRIVAEITERSFVHSEAASLEALTALRRHGIGIALDDFGTGYSSLSYLTRLPIDELKLDQSFTAELGRNLRGEQVTECVIALARVTHLEVIAEGVENVAQREWLRAAGCDAAQGYLIARPMPAADVPAFLAGATLLREAA